MIKQTGNMWDAFTRADIFCITTNSQLDRRGHLIMGAGIALETKKRFPGMPRMWGDVIKAHGGEDHYFFHSPSWTLGNKLAALQTKRSPSEDSPLELIVKSLRRLDEFAKEHPRASILLPLPGAGKGRIEPRLAWSLVSYLPDNCEAWTFE